MLKSSFFILHNCRAFGKKREGCGPILLVYGGYFGQPCTLSYLFYYSLYCKFNLIQGADKVVVVEKFSNVKKWLQKTSSGTFSTQILMFVLLISNHTVFLVQCEINLHLWVFQKAKIALAVAALAISAFWKTHSCKLFPNWTRNRMITYTKYDCFLVQILRQPSLVIVHVD